MHTELHIYNRQYTSVTAMNYYGNSELHTVNNELRLLQGMYWYVGKFAVIYCLIR